MKRLTLILSQHNSRRALICWVVFAAVIFLTLAGCSRTDQVKPDQEPARVAEKQASGENVLKPVPPEERREICSLPPEVIKKLGYDPESCNDWIACRVMLSEYGPKGRATIAQNGKVKGTIETDYRNDEIAFPIKYGDKVEIRWIPGESKGGNPTCQITFWKIDKRVNIDPNLPTVSLDAIDLKEEANWQQGGWYKFPPSGSITFEYTEKGMIINAQKE